MVGRSKDASGGGSGGARGDIDQTCANMHRLDVIDVVSFVLIKWRALAKRHRCHGYLRQ